MSIPGIPLEFSSDYQRNQFRQFSEKLKKESHLKLSEDQQQFLVVSWLPSQNLSLVRDCVHNAVGTPFWLDTEHSESANMPDGAVKILVYTAKGKVKLTEAPAVVGGSLVSGSLGKGSVLQHNAIFSVKRQGRSPIVVELATDQGRQVLTLAGLPEPIIKPREVVWMEFKKVRKTDRSRPNFLLNPPDRRGNIRVEIEGGDGKASLTLRHDIRGWGPFGRPDRNYIEGLTDGSAFPKRQYQDAFWQVSGVPRGKTINIKLYLDPDPR
jgi:hypothetical protein